MIRNFFITAFRNFRKNFSHSVLNIVGLSLGMACCLVVFTIINFEYSFDDWHEKKDRIYRFTNIYHGDNQTSYSGIVPYPTGGAIRDNIPDFEKVVEFHGPQDEKLSFTDAEGAFQVYREEKVLYTNEHFFEVLDFEILKGDKGSLLQEPNKIMLTETLAEKYFRDQDPLGQIIRMNNEVNLEVVAIIQDSPKNTNLPFDCIVSLATLKGTEPNIWSSWGMTWAYSVYVLTQPGADIEALNAKLDQVLDGQLGPDNEEGAKKTNRALQPLSEIHIDEKYGDGSNYVTPSLMIWAFVFLGFLILGTACLNFINLSTAQALRRSKEVGVRKTLGSSKFQLVSQFLTETFLTVFISMMIAFSLGQFLLQKFNQILSMIEYDLQYSNEVIIFSVLLSLVVTVLAGFYPSMILSGYRPVEALKKKISITKGSGSFNLRRALVVTQFAFTTIMLIATLIVAAQVNFMKSEDLGFDFTNVVKVETPFESETDPKGLLEAYKAKSYVQDATLSFTSPISTGSNWNNSYRLPNEEYIDGNNANMKFIEAHYLDFYQIPLIAGSTINDQFINDSTYNVLVNEHLLSTLGWSNPEEAIGRTITSGNGTNQWKVIGVVKDFNVHTLQNRMRPAMLMYRPEFMHQIAIKLPSDRVSEHLSDIESTFRSFYPNELFEFSILKSEINENYLMEDLLHKVARFISVLAILLSIMGLYGLVSFMANRNAKIIGIRKVFGASTSNILQIFTREYVKLMIISFVFAAPAAYFLISMWIEEFAFRIDIGMSYFIFGFLITLLIATLTVGYRSFIAARENPIKSLRYE